MWPSTPKSVLTQAANGIVRETCNGLALRCGFPAEEPADVRGVLHVLSRDGESTCHNPVCTVHPPCDKAFTERPCSSPWHLCRETRLVPRGAGVLFANLLQFLGKSPELSALLAPRSMEIELRVATSGEGEVLSNPSCQSGRALPASRPQACRRCLAKLDGTAFWISDSESSHGRLCCEVPLTVAGLQQFCLAHHDIRELL